MTDGGEIGVVWRETESDGGKQSHVEEIRDTRRKLGHFEEEINLKMWLLSYIMQTCECGVSFTCKYNLQRHQLSRAHELNMRCGTSLTADDCGFYKCEHCDYSTSHKGHFRKHMLSAKHIGERDRKASAVAALSVPSSVSSPPISLAASDSITPVMLREIVEIILTIIPAIQNTTPNANAVATPTATQNAGLLITGNSNVVTNNNNQKFNLNVFLNEECKNAMNMNEFIQRVNITSEDLEHLGEVGYTDGMSKILTKAMRGMETTERPMHCTDTKRETIYVRKDDAWKKDDDCEETKRLITHIAHKNYKALTEWRNEHPEHTEHDTADYEAWYSISRNMCNTDPSALKKLIRHLALTTAVEKKT